MKILVHIQISILWRRIDQFKILIEISLLRQKKNNSVMLTQGTRPRVCPAEDISHPQLANDIFIDATKR